MVLNHGARHSACLPVHLLVGYSLARERELLVVPGTGTGYRVPGTGRGSVLGTGSIVLSQVMGQLLYLPGCEL